MVYGATGSNLCQPSPGRIGFCTSNGDFIFGATDRLLTCVNMKTGKRVWAKRGYPDASCVYGDGKLIILDQDGRRVSQYDGNGYPTAYWQVGDLVISRFPLDIPGDLAPGSYTVRAGIYSWPEIINIPAIDPQGNAVDDGVTMGKLEIKNDQ